MPRIHVEHFDDRTIIIRFQDNRLSDPLLLDRQRGEMKKVLALAGAGNHFVLDFQGVVFVITNGLNNMLTFNAQIARAGGRLVLCQITPQFREILERTNLVDVFTIRETLDEAIQTLRG